MVACGLLVLVALYSLFFVNFCISSSLFSTPAAATEQSQRDAFTLSRPPFALSEQPHSHAPVSRGTLETTALIPASPAFPADSTLTLFAIRGRGPSSPENVLHFCSLSNVAVHYNNVSRKSLLLLRFTSWQQWQHVQRLSSQCWTAADGRGEENSLCRPCFHPQFTFSVLPYEWSRDVSAMTAEQREQYRVKPDPFLPASSPALTSGLHPLSFDHSWSVHKWVRHQHIAHWAQKLLMFQSVFQHRSLFRHLLPEPDSLLFHDTDADVTEHQQAILNSSLHSALDDSPLLLQQQRQRIVWASELESRSALSLLTPLRRLSLTPHYGIFSTHSDDTIAFRSSVYARFELPPVSRCPPPQVTLLYRENRRMLNQRQIIDLLQSEFRLQPVVATVNETSSSREQVSLFARSGLMLSSHSSQLINVLFSQPGSAVVEVSPEFYNADFSEYAHGMGLFFQYALGGEVDPADPLRQKQPLHEACVQLLSHCDGYSHCILRERWRCQASHYPNKNLNFIANLTAVRIAVRNAIGHLDWLCDGRFREQRRAGG